MAVDHCISPFTCQSQGSGSVDWTVGESEAVSPQFVVFRHHSLGVILNGSMWANDGGLQWISALPGDPGTAYGTTLLQPRTVPPSYKSRGRRPVSWAIVHSKRRASTGFSRAAFVAG